MIRYLLIAIIATTLNSQASAQGINFFQGTFKEALEKARIENKKVFVDVYTTWCGPCKKMAKTTFVDKEVGDFYNKNFINLKIDAEKGEGINIKEQYSVAGYPTLLYLNPNGEVIKKLASFADAAFFIELGKSTLNVNDNFAELKAKYNKKNITTEELYQYLVLLKAKGVDDQVSKVFDQYFIQASEKANTEELLIMVPEYASSSDSKAFQYLLNNRKGFDSVVGAEKVSELINDFYLYEFRYRKTFKTDEKYWAAKKILKTRITVNDTLDVDLNVDHYFMTKDEDNFIKESGILIEKFRSKDSQTISNILGATYWVEKKESLLKLEEWAKLAVELDDSFVNNGQLAFVYYNLKDMEKGDKYYSKTLELGKDPKFSGYVPRFKELKKYFLEKSIK